MACASSTSLSGHEGSTDVLLAGRLSASGGVGLAAAPPSDYVRPERGGTMKPEDVVRAELDAWGRLDVEEIISHFAPDAVYENVPIGAATGIEEIRTTVEQFVKDMTFFDAETIHLAVAGNVVLTERVDHIVMGGTKMDLRLMGVFEIDGDKVRAWRDYFDVAGLA
jgi:limonene-1,2-epoxide hydrolase